MRMTASNTAVTTDIIAPSHMRQGAKKNSDKITSLAHYQSDFAARVRSGRTAEPDPYNSRAALYHRLIFDNMCTFIDCCFPVCRSLINASTWKQLCVAFFREHRCQTPLFHQIPLEFISWLQQPTRYRHFGEPAYLTHLALYEYAELQVQTAPDIIHYGTAPNSVRLITPIELGSYPYPVHRIGLQNPNPYLANTRILLWRKIDDAVGFAEITAPVYQLLELLKQQSWDLGALFVAWSQLFELPPGPEHYVASLQDLAQLDVAQVCQ